MFQVEVSMRELKSHLCKLENVDGSEGCPKQKVQYMSIPDIFGFRENRDGVPSTSKQRTGTCTMKEGKFPMSKTVITVTK